MALSISEESQEDPDLVTGSLNKRGAFSFEANSTFNHENINLVPDNVLGFKERTRCENGMEG